MSRRTRSKPVVQRAEAAVPASAAKASAQGGVGYWYIPVILAAVVVRVLYFVQFGKTPFAHYLFLDSALYDQWARCILHGPPFDPHRPFFIEPGYAYVLALVKVLHGGIAATRVIQAILGIGTALITGLIARRLAGDGAALAAGLITALYVPLIYFEGLVLKTTIEVLVWTLILYLSLVAVDRPSRWIGFLFGLIVGVSDLVRSNVVALAVVIPVWSYFVLRSRGERLPWVFPTCFAAGVAIVLVGIAVRNGRVSGDYQPMTTNAGLNFYTGNSLASDGFWAMMTFMRNDPMTEEDDSINEAARRLGHSVSPREASNYWMHATWGDVEEKPARWAELMVTKVGLYLNRYELSDDVSIYMVQVFVPMLHWPLPGYWLAVPLGVAGLFLAMVRRRPDWILAVVFLLVQASVVVVFHVAERYRLASVPIMVALGCAAVASVLPRAVNRPGLADLAGAEIPREAVQKHRIFVAAGLLLGAILVALPSRIQNLAAQYDMVGVAALQSDRGDQALAAFRQAIEMEPTAEHHYYFMGIALQKFRHDDAGAEADLRTAIRLGPTDGNAYSVLASVLHEEGREVESAAAFQKAAELGIAPVRSYVGAASAYGRVKQYDKANAMVLQALALAPGDPEALQLLGNLRFLRGDRAGAKHAWEESLNANPNNPGLSALLAQVGH
ncbi:MAG: tetratricopeptide repeat protein [Capsulimonadaceae bacterium]